MACRPQGPRKGSRQTGLQADPGLKNALQPSSARMGGRRARWEAGVPVSRQLRHSRTKGTRGSARAVHRAWRRGGKSEICWR